MEQYKVFDHEADIGFEVFGKTNEELYGNAARALFSLLVDQTGIEPAIEKRLVLAAENDSLVVFLNDLLYFWDTEKFIPETISTRTKNDKLIVIVKGQHFDENHHRTIGQVKAVTYHRFSITEEAGQAKATFIVDI